MSGIRRFSGDLSDGFGAFWDYFGWKNSSRKWRSRIADYLGNILANPNANK